MLYNVLSGGGILTSLLISQCGRGGGGIGVVREGKGAINFLISGRDAQRLHKCLEANGVAK
jgi:hypothetical protein